MKLISHSPSETLSIARKLSGKAEKGDIICLFGELGSGKTVFARGLACGLGVKKEKVISPSFVLLRSYKGKKLDIFHFDLYRLLDAQDILALGYEDYIYSEAVSIIEWADRLKYLMPKKFIKVELKVLGGKKRLIEIKREER